MGRRPACHRGREREIEADKYMGYEGIAIEMGKFFKGGPGGAGHEKRKAQTTRLSLDPCPWVPSAPMILRPEVIFIVDYPKVNV